MSPSPILPFSHSPPLLVPSPLSHSALPCYSRTMPADQHLAFLELAQRAAQRAGALIRTSVHQVKQVEHKSAIDLVTSIDRESEQIIVDLIQEHYPEHSIVAEEGTEISHNHAEYQWIIDPVDGTTNFVHGLPYFCVSIALTRGDTVVVGLVYDPMRDEAFTAMHGRGACLNGVSVTASDVEELDKALLATGFPDDRRQRADEYLALFKEFMKSAQDIRRGGSAALDLCYVASGRLDGLWAQGLHAWDVAAGSLIVREAGGMSTDFRGQELDVWGSEILCSNGRIHEEMVCITRET